MVAIYIRQQIAPCIILIAIVQSTPRCPECSGCEGICLFIQNISGIMNPPNNIQRKNYKAVFLPFSIMNRTPKVSAYSTKYGLVV